MPLVPALVKFSVGMKSVVQNYRTPVLRSFELLRLANWKYFKGGERRGREQHSLTTQSKEAPNIDVRGFLDDHTDRVTRAAYLLVY
uniref:Uncharacterized protein n=1 Tax=uncultured bacterium HF4000_05M23 TaxID=542534 RepID=E0XPZ4_9BACT|nr:hypothetical protein [uncultured bacterium HF4000_05M23]